LACVSWLALKFRTLSQWWKSSVGI